MASEVKQSRQYTLLHRIGHSDTVYQAKRKATKEFVAIKKVYIDKEDLAIAKRVIAKSQRLHNKYLVKRHSTFIEESTYFCIMEYCNAGSIACIMERLDIRLNEGQISRILYNVLKALEFLHGKHFVHRNIRAYKILINDRGIIKLGFPHTRYWHTPKRNRAIVSPYWLAPEVICELETTNTQDIWSLGITAIQMAEGNPPLFDVHPVKALYMISRNPPPTLTTPELWTSNFNSFLTFCLKKNQRIGVQQSKH